ncbi:MAG: hypothetical protein ACXVDZ_16995 [Bacteroidia bacterium]
MMVHFALAYDRLTEKDPLVSIIEILLSAEAQNMVPVLGSTIHFTLDLSDEAEAEWVLDKISRLLEKQSYFKLYNYGLNVGQGKIFNPNQSSKEDNKYIGDAFIKAKRIAEINVKPFRSDFRTNPIH